ncbi:EAL domain-containing protein [Komagataeibacter oboediens]|uniref:EAL domain-containing protein n=1 Tax=Komagataeibacter oboediens TaxID=65958 RepID=A0ABS5SKD5_9PROT|nr:EAL domain-containing protein [Komagataeibacter oboediens]MBT0674674.1 EAL domain-containing protein [Komagataeibacter oboediens]MBT0677550.1 EAL domain-containing protein [Komagataeibacter oboediens]MBV0887446.1 EAL domain-containing protein [Komagataeibacter oboediens]MBV1824484.1 EAL domain-containing protein [Komagataeibacter oboediens]
MISHGAAYRANVLEFTVDQPKISADVLLSAMEQAIDPMVVIDEHNCIIFFNAAAERIWGLSRAQVMGQNVSCLVPQADRAQHDSYINRNRETGIGRIVGTSREVEFRRANGEYVCGELSISRVQLDETGGIYYIAVMKDVTEQSRQRKILILQNDVLQALASDLSVQEVGDQLCRRVDGFVPGGVAALMTFDEARKVVVTSSPGMPARYRSALDSMQVTPEQIEAMRHDPGCSNTVVWDGYSSLARSLGLVGCRSSAIISRSGQVVGIFALYLRDDEPSQGWPERVVSTCMPFCALAIEQNETRQHIAQLSNFDSLTGLLNRTSLHNIIERLIMRGGDSQFSLFMVDIDRFRDINDALGHVNADRFLIEIGRRIRALVNDEYIVSRSGGDEFIIVVPDCSHQRAEQFAEKLINSIAKPLQVGENTLSISCCVGISTFPENGPDSESLLSLADAAARQAKEDGRGLYRFAGHEKNQVAQERLMLGSALRDSLAKGMLNLHYQPQVETMTGGLYGVEALSRWHHPTLGNIYPSRFIAVAEDTGQIEAIGRWSLQEACGQMVKWDRDGVHVPTVAVNLSAVHFRNRALPEYIANLLKHHNLTPDRLTVEITESVMMDNSTDTEDVLHAIRRLDVGLSMDDFGTGYSSLSRLTRLPLTEIKIDRSFINDFEQDTNAQAVTMAVIGIGSRLGMTVVTEGVETEQQWRLLEELHCDVMQGYLFAKPLPPAELEKWFRERQEQGSFLIPTKV